jgi:hypothetical protein
MSFKKFGGLNYSAKSNIISNHYSNSGNLGITDTLGQPNSKIVSQSHIDMSANSIMNIGSLYFMDGTMQTTALETNPSGTVIFNNGIIVSNVTTTDTLHVTETSQLDGNVTVTTGNLTVTAGDLTVTAGSTFLQDTTIQTGDLTVTAGSTFLQDTTIQTGDLTVTVGGLTVTGLSSLNGGITVNDGNNDVFTVGTNGDTTIGPLSGTSSTALTVNGGISITTENLPNQYKSAIVIYNKTNSQSMFVLGPGTTSTGDCGGELLMKGAAAFTGLLSTDAFVISYGTESIPSEISCDSNSVDIKTPTIKMTTATVTISGSCTAQTFTSTSDYRIKENIQNLDESFNVDKLRPVTYTNKNTKKQDIGFIAHEVREEFPYLVSGEKDGEQMQSLNYIGLIGVLVKEIQDLKKRVQILENK